LDHGKVNNHAIVPKGISTHKSSPLIKTSNTPAKGSFGDEGARQLLFTAVLRSSSQCRHERPQQATEQTDHPKIPEPQSHRH